MTAMDGSIARMSTPLQTPPEPAAEWVATEKLRPWAHNPRKNDQVVERVADSIRRFGFGAPIIARKADGEVIAGHTRLKAAIRLGLPRVPVRYLDLDPADAHLLALADNKTSELADWDEAALGLVLEQLRAEDMDLLAGTGFSDAEIQRLIDGAHANEGGATGDDAAALDRPSELQQKWSTAVGQHWEVPSKTVPGRVHRLACGDSTDREVVARLFDGAVASWMWTDPPYGVEYEGKTGDALKIRNDGAEGLPALLAAAFANADRVLAEGAPIYIAHPAGPLAVEFGCAFLGAGWHLHQTLVWVKNAMVLGHSDYHYRHEPLLYGWKGSRSKRPWFGGRDKDSVLAFDRPAASEEHPTMKPIELIAHCLRSSSASGSLGYEPFGGSGSTLLAAEQLGRLCYGIELDPRYAAVILERLAALGLEPRRV